MGDRIIRYCRVLAFTTAMIVAGLCAGEPLEGVEKAITEACLKHTSVSYRFESVTMLNGKKSSAQTGTYEAALQGGKWKRRSESTVENSMTVDASGKPMNRWALSVDDGAELYNLELNGDEFKATRQPSLNKAEVKNVEEVLGDIRNGNEVELLPEEKLNGHEVYVLSVSSVKKRSKERYLISKEMGIVLKAQRTFPGNATLTIMTTVSEFTIDAKIPADRFAFTCPPGVVVKDIHPARKKE